MLGELRPHITGLQPKTSHMASTSNCSANNDGKAESSLH